MAPIVVKQSFVTLFTKNIILQVNIKPVNKNLIFYQIKAYYKIYYAICNHVISQDLIVVTRNNILILHSAS
ncbi:hypothetical protein LCAC16_270082 [Leuconostoc carnosum]|nr:hypothetical protein LCAC16_270082 [Leuconostoc carnosum]